MSISYYNRRRILYHRQHHHSEESAPMNQLLSREELLAGGVAGRLTKQASTLLALIENRAAYALQESRQAAIGYAPATTSAARAQSYLEALAQGRRRTYQPTIRDLERYARQWAELAPASPSGRAAIAHLLGAKYRFTARVTPGVRAALGLDTPAVQTAYQQQYGQPLANIYAPRLGLVEQVRWVWARLAGWLENLSPFWAAFALTLTELVGAGILALPIAVAGVGPLAGVGMLLVFGLLNLLTLAGVAEAITRNGNMRYGFSYFGRLLGDYLGSGATVAFSLALLLINLIALLAYQIGIATTLTAATGLPKILWLGLLGVITFYILRRRSLDSTVASALVIGFVNIGLIVLLALLTLPHISLVNLTYLRVPFVNNQPFDPGLLGLIFGTVLSAFFGHTSVGNMAKTVLHRDPGGRTLLWGNLAAMTVALLLYSLWIVVVNGALPAQLLLDTSGTALIPLATVVGPLVHPIGALFVVLGMGMAAMHMALGLFNQVQEWLPSATATPTQKSAQRSRLGRTGRFWLGVLPTGGIFVLSFWLLLTQRESFTEPISFIGAIAVPLVGGIFPMLLLVASRRTGDYVPAVSWRWLGHPLTVGLITLIFWAGLLVHGLFVWSDPLQRGVALLTSAGLLLLIGWILRSEALTARSVIEVRAGGASKADLQVVSRGQLLAIPVQARKSNGEEQTQTTPGLLTNLSQLRRLRFELPVLSTPQLKVWVHQVNEEGESVALPVQLVLIPSDGRSLQPEMPPTASNPGHGQHFWRLPAQACQVEIVFNH